MTWVKICGMTNLEDALVAAEAGADAVGFVFYEKSPRCVSVETAREICQKLPDGIEKVGVFVGSASSNVLEALKLTGLTAAQVYPDSQRRFPELKDLLFDWSGRVIAAFSAGIWDDLEDDEMCGFFVSSQARDRMFAVLIDSGSSSQPGGTGKKFDWEKMTPLAAGMSRIGLRLVVAGGLNPANVDKAMTTLQPWGVDVVSGVEASPGKKDPEKVRAFVRAVRETDRRVG